MGFTQTNRAQCETVSGRKKKKAGCNFYFHFDLCYASAGKKAGASLKGNGETCSATFDVNVSRKLF